MTDKEEQKPSDQEIELQPDDPCQELQQKNQELQAMYTRLSADFENFKKRTERQNRDLIIRANESLICGLLPVVDNFCLALNSVDDDSVAKGIKMIYDQLLTVLENEGLVAIDSIGCPFNPSIHEAVANVQSQDHGDNIIVEELRKGYMLAGKAIRPGMVKVNIKKEDI